MRFCYKRRWSSLCVIYFDFIKKNILPVIISRGELFIKFRKIVFKHRLEFRPFRPSCYSYRFPQLKNRETANTFFSLYNPFLFRRFSFSFIFFNIFAWISRIHPRTFYFFGSHSTSIIFYYYAGRCGYRHVFVKILKAYFNRVSIRVISVFNQFHKRDPFVFYQLIAKHGQKSRVWTN